MFTHGLVTRRKPREGVLRGSVRKAVPKGAFWPFRFLASFLFISILVSVLRPVSLTSHTFLRNSVSISGAVDSRILVFLSLVLLNSETLRGDLHAFTCFLSSFLVDC